MIEGLEQIAALPDPVGEVVEERVLKNGLDIKRVRAPLGVIGIIYEARPNVTVDAAALCLKSGNSVVLRGGKDALNSNRVLYNIMHEAVERSGMSGERREQSDAGAGGSHRRHHPSRRRGLEKLRAGKREDARHRVRRRQLPHLC